MNRIRVLGIPLHAISLRQAAEAIVLRAEARKPGFACLCNVHMTMTAREDGSFLRVLEEADLVLPDGMPLVHLMRRRVPEQERIAGYDLMMSIIDECAARELKIAFVGTTKETLSAIRAALAGSHPNLQLSGLWSPPMFRVDSFDEDEHARLGFIADAHVVFVGLGCPKQEIWMRRLAARGTAMLVGVGAAFHILADEQSRAPAWVRENSLEWLYRLGQEPRRLFTRYLTTNLRFLFDLARNLRTSVVPVDPP